MIPLISWYLSDFDAIVESESTYPCWNEWLSTTSSRSWRGFENCNWKNIWGNTTVSGLVVLSHFTFFYFTFSRMSFTDCKGLFKTCMILLFRKKASEMHHFQSSQVLPC